MRPEIHEEVVGDVHVRVTYERGPTMRVVGFSIAVPRFQWAMVATEVHPGVPARPLGAPVPVWDVLATEESRQIERGQVRGWTMAAGQIPRLIFKRADPADSVAVGEIFRDFVSLDGFFRRGRYSHDRAALLGQLGNFLSLYGGEATVELLREAAAPHGYRLEPDNDLILKAGGDCQAEHDRHGDALDAIMENPSLENLFAQLGRLEGG